MKNTRRLGWIVFALIIMINVGFYPFLPDRLAVQFNASGVSRTAAKPVALVTIPLIMLVINLVYGNNENKKHSIILAGVILFIVNLVINISNLLIS